VVPIGFNSILNGPNKCFVADREWWANYRVLNARNSNARNIMMPESLR